MTFIHTHTEIYTQRDRGQVKRFGESTISKMVEFVVPNAHPSIETWKKQAETAKNNIVLTLKKGKTSQKTSKC